jgi:hypothetical protein
MISASLVARVRAYAATDAAMRDANPSPLPGEWIHHGHKSSSILHSLLSELDAIEEGGSIDSGLRQILDEDAVTGACQDVADKCERLLGEKCEGCQMPLDDCECPPMTVGERGVW